MALLPKPEPEPEPETGPLSPPTLSPNRDDEVRTIAAFLSKAGKIKKRKRRSSRPSDCLERVSSITADEHVAFRRQIRSTRLLFSSLLRCGDHPILRADGECSSSSRNRVDLAAGSAMNRSSLWLHRDRRIAGPIPGLNIGDAFLYRVELCVVSLHGHVQGGIDFLPSATEPIATSIVVSGNYEDDIIRGPVEVIYTGQGGRIGRNETKHSLNQKLERGNLALERSHHYGVEIRVIRGKDDPGSPSGRLYVYDGLYRVAEWWKDVGKSGYYVFKYRLVRLENQPALPVPGAVRPEKFFLSRDMSKGKEKLPVAVFNDIDDDRDVLDYDYLVRSVFNASSSKGFGGCRCVGECRPEMCDCVKRNGGEMVYDVDNGFLVRGKPVVYECGSHCRCSSDCSNRASQQGMTHRLEVFRSAETGWGVRSLDLIIAGDFICEFSGIALTKEQALVAEAKGKSTLVYPGKFAKRWEEWGDLSMIDRHYKKPTFPPLSELDYALDVSRARNVACYLSHSSLPNVFAQFVLHDHYDTAYPRVMIFASENILPMRELSLDYGL